MTPDSESLGLCLVQPALRPTHETPLAATKRVIELVEKGMADHPDTRIDLVVLPELCPLGYSEDTFARYLPSTPETQKILEEIDLEFQAAAVRWSVAVCYGTIGRESKGIVAENGDESQSATEHSYFIRQAVIGPGGESLASYDKIHLCDYGDCAETRFFRPGSSAVSFSLNGWKFGVMVCADIRYPMLSRQLVRDHGVDVLLQPACFIRDISFRTWKSFRETRAVENGVYFAAGNYAGREFGEASLVPPWVDEDHEPQVLGTEECCLVARLDKRALNKARDELPFHRHVCSSGV